MRKIITGCAGAAAVFMAAALAPSPARAIALAAPAALARAAHAANLAHERGLCLRLVGPAMLDNRLRVLLSSVLR